MKPDKYSMFYSVAGINFVRQELVNELVKFAQKQVLDDLLEEFTKLKNPEKAFQIIKEMRDKYKQEKVSQ